MGRFVASNIARTAKKTGGTSRASTVTLTADPVLAISADASSFYAVRAVLAFGNNGVLNGCRVKISTSGGGGSFVMLYTASNNGTGVSFAPLSTTKDSEPMIKVPNVALVDDVIVIDGVIQTSAAGVVSVDWAQNTSNITAVTLQAGSYLSITKL